MMAADSGGVNGGLICKRLINNALIIVCIDFLNLPVMAFPRALETCFMVVSVCLDKVAQSGIRGVGREFRTIVKFSKKIFLLFCIILNGTIVYTIKNMLNY